MSDQAQELRRVFDEGRPTRRLLVSSLKRPALSLAVAASICRDSSSLGQDVLWIDDLPLLDREDWPIPRAAKFTLEQVQQGFIPLAAAVAIASDGSHYIHSGRTTARNVIDASAGKTFDLALTPGRLERYELVLLTSSQEDFDGLSAAGAKPDIIIVSGTAAAECSELMLWMVRCEASLQPRRWGLCFIGDQYSSNRAWAELSPLFTRYLTGPVELLATADGNLTEISLGGAWVPERKRVLSFIDQ